ncbi:CHAD domain-containing protein [Methylomonas sp. AM2-LC]|uniref:CHAD domain-containing protein n=1 Tax=Methylomonas sp. AM2-LC TaxID=3153301 RepID=UPI003264C6F5
MTAAGKFLLNAFEQQWHTYLQQVKLCRHDCNSETIHDLRTCSRQLLATIQLIQTLSPKRPIEKARKVIKTLLDSFDELRDTQVMLLEINQHQIDIPELVPFYLYLTRKEAQLLLQSQVYLSQYRSYKLKQKLKKTTLFCKRLCKNHNLAAEILMIIDEIYATLLTRNQNVDITDLSTIHHLRLSVKKLRYLLSTLQPILPDSNKKSLEQIKSHLTLLGNIQNSAVLTNNLRQFYKQQMPETIHTAFQKQQQELLQTFIQQQDIILNFW